MENFSSPKVAICLSVFNGEKYLAEQIESIIEQTFKSWRLFIHDDGSTDASVSVIRKLAAKDSRIVFLDNEDHLGVVKSFFELVMEASADYYMFCDQDDIWESRKIRVMLNRMLSENINVPVLAHSEFSLIDDKGAPIPSGNRSLFKESKFDNLTLNNNVVGCTTMFNKCLADMIVGVKSKIDYENIFMHDWFVALIASSMGKIVLIEDKLVRYRQHGGNAVGAPGQRRFIKQIKRRFVEKKKLKIELILGQVEQIGTLFVNRLNQHDKYIIHILGRVKDNYAPLSNTFLLLKNGLNMGSFARNMQFCLYLFLPISWRKRMF